MGQKRAALATWARGQRLGRRFWQARAVESFLRGTTSYADQMFLLKRGLLEVMAWRSQGVGCPILPAAPCVALLPEPWTAGQEQAASLYFKMPVQIALGLLPGFQLWVPVGA